MKVSMTCEACMSIAGSSRGNPSQLSAKRGESLR
eukprot:CAMPEP_0172000776 /NCGR_PEP_ID=MMETSP1041-20130122/2499_1 /TAXON_ID=464988 /ORGANISM="Hemiselmis andersenii, Strain CCMP439" /LENGTH=33 /DNA_ID= /DNA_START= /DNA_END= /DNA_ORIENTATION=